MTKTRQRNVVLVGSGHAHIQVLEAFAHEPLPDDVRITVIVDKPIAMYSGMVPGYVGGQYTREQLEIDARPLVQAIPGAELIVKRAQRIDAERKQIHLAGEVTPVDYDLASINIGSTVAGLNIPGVREHTLPTRPIDGLVDRIEELIEKANRHDSEENPFRMLVVGGGAGGVELAFTTHHRLRFETGRPVEAVIVHNRAEILEGSPGALIRRVHRWAVRRGIDIQCGRKVDSVDADAVHFADGETLDCQAVLWVTGPTSHPLFRNSEIATDERGFVRIRDTLQCEEHDDLYAVGDCATFIDHPRTPKAGVYAVREGPYIAHNLRAMLRGDPLMPYTPQRDFLMLMNLGGGHALGSKWGLSFEGNWVMRWKDHIDRKFMRRFQVLDAKGHLD